ASRAPQRSSRNVSNQWRARALRSSSAAMSGAGDVMVRTLARREAVCLPQRLAGRHGDGHRNVERTHIGPERNRQARLGSGMDLVGNAGGLTPEQQDIARTEGMIEIGNRCPCRKKHDPQAFLPPPLVEAFPAGMADDGHPVQVVHAGAAEGAVGNREAGRFDDMRLDTQASAEPQNRPAVLRYIGLEKGDAERHGISASGWGLGAMGYPGQ